MIILITVYATHGVAPVRERGLKSPRIGGGAVLTTVAPVRERGLKLYLKGLTELIDSVAPVRERGLK